jgi:hypothetical protein
MRTYRRLVLVLLAIVAARTAGAAQPDDASLAGVRIGARATTLATLHPGLYRHVLTLGEVLYEACDQKNLIVFTFAEERQAPGRITNIIIDRAEPAEICHDASGSLPDLGIDARTPRGLAIGDAQETVEKLYGTPALVRRPKLGEVWEYDIAPPPDDSSLKSVKLLISLSNGRVSGLSLDGTVQDSESPAPPLRLPPSA